MQTLPGKLPDFSTVRHLLTTVRDDPAPPVVAGAL